MGWQRKINREARTKFIGTVAWYKDVTIEQVARQIAAK